MSGLLNRKRCVGIRNEQVNAVKGKNPLILGSLEASVGKIQIHMFTSVVCVCVCVCVRTYVRVCVRVCTCVRSRERERERESSKPCASNGL